MQLPIPKEHVLELSFAPHLLVEFHLRKSAWFEPQILVSLPLFNFLKIIFSEFVLSLLAHLILNFIFLELP